MENTHTEEENLHGIDNAYVYREIIGSLIATIFISLFIYGIGWLIVYISTDDGKPVDQSALWPIIFGIIIGVMVIINVLNYIFSVLYVNNFSYSITE